MSETVTISDGVYKQAEKIANEKDTTIKDAIRQMCREGGYDV